MAELKERVLGGQYRPIAPGRYSPALVNLMHGLLSLNPARRPDLVVCLF